MSEIWEDTFASHQLMWGREPTMSARMAAERFAERGAREVLIPGVGYGRNAAPFVDRGMSVTGIEISETAIALAREKLGLSLPIHHGSVTEMPFDDRRYDGIFCYGLIYLLGPAERAKLIADCFAQLAPGGQMVFTLITTDAPMYGQGERLGEDWYAVRPGMTMFFYDEASAQTAFAPFGAVELARVDEPVGGGKRFPFLVASVSRGEAEQRG